jgi:hypothetical protein
MRGAFMAMLRALGAFSIAAFLCFLFSSFLCLCCFCRRHYIGIPTEMRIVSPITLTSLTAPPSPADPSAYRQSDPAPRVNAAHR